jgi:putative ABC transport system permease protein
VAAGRHLALLGEVVVGHEAAEILGVGPGDSLLSEALNAYDPGQSFQLKMNVVGVLAPSQSPDDTAVFTDVQTAWVIDGIGHGHMEVAGGPASGVVDQNRSDQDNLVATGKLATYQEITESNRDSFHFHGDQTDYPLTAVLFVPDSDKSRTLARARFAGSETRDLVPPLAVVEELMDVIFRFKRLLDANFFVVTLTTAVFLALIVVLSVRIRKPEMETLSKIGCARSAEFWLQAIELGYLIVLSVIVAAVLVGIFTLAAPNLVELVR